MSAETFFPAVRRGAAEEDECNQHSAAAAASMCTKKAKKSLTVCVLPPLGKPEAGSKERVFRTFTRDLREMRS